MIIATLLSYSSLHASAKPNECLNYKIHHRHEHYDKSQNVLSIEHKNYVNCLTTSHKLDYKDLLNEIKLRLNPKYNSAKPVSYRKRYSCLYRMKKTNVNFDDFMVTCVNDNYIKPE